MKEKIFFVLLIACCCYLSITQKPYLKNPILDKWMVNIHNCPKGAGQPQRKFQLKTTLPTTIHMDLFAHNKIQDPYFGSNWQKQKWISQCSAIYSKNISISEQILQFDVVNFVFEGIDTYSTIKINSKQLLKTQNAFVEYKANIKSLIKPGMNLLEIEIIPTKYFDDKGQSQNHMPFDYAHTRKPCYQYSWDWAPYMNTLGVWKNVYFEAYDLVSLDYVWVQLQELSENVAFLTFSVKVNIFDSESGHLKDFGLVVEHQGKELNRTHVAGSETYFVVKIDQPKLWWPNGIGQPHMYDFLVKLISKQKTIQQKKIAYGIRTVKLDQSNNAFTLYVNGYKVYCKGANYVPPDMMYPRLANMKKITTLLEDAVISNFNMIRLWGGGQYEYNEFYELASRKGIMIFHDFMFSDSIYPSNDNFLENVLVEVVQQIRRIRNYPALALWAGNNEIFQGIQSWGWSSQKYRKDYKKLFEEHIQKIVLSESPYIPYVPSSPVKGVGNGGFERGGDVHYWGVWAGGAAFENYEFAVGPFNSEFGTQSLPLWQSIKQLTSNQQSRSYSSAQLLSHQRHNSQFHTLRKYMQQYAKPSHSFQLQTYQSGLVQAYAIEIAIKAQRASKNTKSMGTLYWQMNDAWPAVSWSAIDYSGRWKPLQYKAKTLYENLIAFYHHRSRKVVVVNDYLYDVECLVETKVVGFDGVVYKNWSEVVRLRENEAKNLTNLEEDRQILDTSGSKMLVFTKLTLADGKQVSVSTFLKPYKDLQLPKCQLHIKFDLKKNAIHLAAKCLIKSVHLYHAFKYLAFTDNYIDVIPGEIHETLLLGEDLAALKKDIKFRSYLQVYEQEELIVIYDE